MNNVVLIEHPVIAHKLTLLRNKDTSHKDFRELLKELSSLMVYEISRHMELDEIEIETPLERTKGFMLTSEIALVPILRAGLIMAEGILELIPTAKVGHIGLYRNEETLKPVEYYCKLPKDVSESEVLVLDPMLATGGSASLAIDLIKKHNSKNIRLISIISAPEGIKIINEDHPDVPIYTLAIDRQLNNKGYILPGLGDAGDRIFGTK